MPPVRNRYNLNTEEALPATLRSQSGERIPSPIVSISVGSAGMARTARWFRKMAALGVYRRIQSMAVYDCNGTGIYEWEQACQHYGVNGVSITPSYLPLSEGFLRQPDDYLEYAGPIERDMERVVDRMEELATGAWSRPQVILEWIGFGGHAKLSNLFHELVTDRFPGAQVLPIYCLPNERVLEANIRDYDLWQESEDAIGQSVALITDNRTTANLAVLDERVAVGLAAIESCFRYRPESGTLAEVVATFNLDECRWLSLDTTELPFPVKNYRWWHIRRRRNELPKATDLSGMAQMVKEAVWKIADPANSERHTGFFAPWPNSLLQRIFVVLPFPTAVVDEVRDDVQDCLQRENFRKVYDGTSVHFGTGDARWLERKDCAFGHVVKMSGLPADPMPISLSRVLDGADGFSARRRRFPTRGDRMAAAAAEPPV